MSDIVSNLTAQSLMESWIDPVAVINQEGIIQYVNLEFINFSNVSSDNLIGKHFLDSPIFDSLPSDQKEKEKEKFNHDLSVDIPPCVEYRVEKGDSALLFISTRSAFLKDDDGNTSGAVMIIRDITDLKLAEQELQKFSLAIENSPISVVITDTCGTIEYVNLKFVELTGYSVEEVIGQNPRVLKSGQTPDETYTNLWNTITAGKKWRGTFVNKKKNGELYLENAWISPIIGPHGEIMHFVAVKEDITKRVKAEQELQELNQELERRVEERTAELQKNEALLRATLETTADGILVTDNEQSIMLTNTQFGEMWEIPEGLIRIGNEQMLRDYMIDQLENSEIFLKKLYKLYESPETTYDILEFKDGSIFERYTSPLIQDGGLTGRVWSFRDITEKKRSEEIIKQERDKAQNYLDVARTILVALDTDGNVTLLNKRGCEILGCLESDVLGQNWFDIAIPKRLQNEVLKTFSELMTGQVEHIEYYENPIVTKNGEERLIAWYNTLLTDKSGNIVGSLSSGEDITEKKKAEDELRKSESRYKDLFMHSPVPLWEEDYTEVSEWLDQLRLDGIIDLKSYLINNPESLSQAVSLIRIIDVNNAVLKIVEANNKEHLLDNLEILFTENVWNAFQDQLQAIWDRNPNPLEWELESQTLKNNPYQYILTWKSTEIAGKMDMSRVIVGTLDITQLKQAEWKLVNALDHAEFFVDLMSHDLSNINQAVYGTLELLLFDDNMPNPVIEIINEALQQVQRGTKLISDVKKFRHIEQDTPELIDKDIANALTSALQDVRNDVPDKDIVIDTNIELGKFHVYADEYLTDVFYTLIHNAVKFDAQDTVKLEVLAEFSDDDPTLRISVTDYGKGIPDTLKEYLFSRISKKKEGFWGTGMGLTLTKRIIDHYNGQIRVEDRIQGDCIKGTRFVLEIPRAISPLS
jgi:PAS domain S-box-containing protein